MLLLSGTESLAWFGDRVRGPAGRRIYLVFPCCTL